MRALTSSCELQRMPGDITAKYISIFSQHPMLMSRGIIYEGLRGPPCGHWGKTRAARSHPVSEHRTRSQALRDTAPEPFQPQAPQCILWTGKQFLPSREKYCNGCLFIKKLTGTNSIITRNEMTPAWHSSQTSKSEAEFVISCTW